MMVEEIVENTPEW
jgi:hypothetical protein